MSSHHDPARPSPEQLLGQAEEEERAESRGRLKIFLGYSSRVGKSYRMLDESRRRAHRGQDVVVGAVQDQRSREVNALLAELEVIPLRPLDGGWDMDVPAILRRRPQLCVLDGLAFSNPLGATRPERWQEAQLLLDAGISVAASINLQFIAERRDEVAAIIGAPRTGPAVPESFIQTADEIELVDAPPEAAAANQARPLAALRELALLLTAEVVDHQLGRYLARHGIDPAWGTQERILLCLTDAPAAAMIASARRNAERFHGELFALHVAPSASPLSVVVEHNLAAAAAAGAQVIRCTDRDYVAAILRIARERGITQIFIGHPRHPSRWWHRRRWFLSAFDRLIERAHGADIRVFPLPPAPPHAAA